MSVAEQTEHWLSLARSLLEQPTAPLREHLPHAAVKAFAAERPGLETAVDAAGNLRVTVGGNDPALPLLVLVAHLDHPGFHIKGVNGSRVDLSFHGGVGGSHAIPGTGVRFFVNGQQDATGCGRLVSSKDPEGRLTSAEAEVTSGRAEEGGYAMWDFPGFEVVDGFIRARCCDDLLGAAAILCVLDALHRNPPAGVRVWGLFTRSEETGFLGTLEAIRLGTVPKDASVLSLECSKALSNAPQGGGVIVRVGDRASIFNPDLSQALRVSAEILSGQDESFKFQRRLMDGGACEATPFCARGYRASGLAVPLGNYHNQATDADGKPCIGAESVAISDFISEVRLLDHLARQPDLWTGRPADPPWVKELEARAQSELSAHPLG